MSNRQQRRAQKPPKARTTVTDPATILWFSNAPWSGTGYSTQTAQAVTRMRRDGHNVAISNNYGLQGMRTVWEDIPVYPMGFEAYSNDVVAANFKDWVTQNPSPRSHIIALFDAWPLRGAWIEEMPVSIWTMVDHMPVPQAVVNVIARPNVTPIAVSRFGQEQMHRAGIEYAPYIPMAIDTKNIYKPTATYNGKTGRELMQFDGDPESYFVASIINANKGIPGRKAWGENLLAFSIFAARHDDARLYIHSERHGNMGGQNLDLLIKAVGLAPHQYRFVNQYAQHVGIPNEAMAALYSATDILMAATYGEGGGLTVVEAGACETPCIVNDFTAQPEMVSQDSYLTDGQPWWDAAQGAWWNIPNVQSIVAALEAAYAKGRYRSTAQREHVRQYDADHVWDTLWRPYMDTLGREPLQSAPPLDAVTTWTRGEPNPDVHLTIYIPTYKREQLADLLTALAPQLTPDVEVIISDNDPDGMGRAITGITLANAPCYVHYSQRPENIGGSANIARGYTAGRGDWLWIVGDDDCVLPDAVANVLAAINSDDLDRLILLSLQAPSATAGMLGSMAELAEVDPGLPIAATLISANVLRRSALDRAKAETHVGTMYGHSWASTSCHRVKVLASPAITVGSDNAGQFSEQSHFTGDIITVWSDLLRDGYGIEPTPESFGWNYVSVQKS